MLRVVLAFALLVASASVATADDFPGGLYAVAGTNPDGTIYEGEAIITNVSEFTCTIEWITADVSSFGICMGRRNNSDAAAFSISIGLGPTASRKWRRFGLTRWKYSRFPTILATPNPSPRIPPARRTSACRRIKRTCRASRRG